VTYDLHLETGWIEQGSMSHIIAHIGDGFLRVKWPNQQWETGHCYNIRHRMRKCMHFCQKLFT